MVHPEGFKPVIVQASHSHANMSRQSKLEIQQCASNCEPNQQSRLSGGTNREFAISKWFIRLSIFDALLIPVLPFDEENDDTGPDIECPGMTECEVFYNSAGRGSRST